MSHELEQFLQFILGSFLVMLVVTSIFAFAFGVAAARNPNGCEYRSIISYHPVRILACELFKQRW
jgi:hypothetical protein